MVGLLWLRRLVQSKIDLFGIRVLVLDKVYMFVISAVLNEIEWIVHETVRSSRTTPLIWTKNT
jgi:hypothetical protein